MSLEIQGGGGGIGVGDVTFNDSEPTLIVKSGAKPQEGDTVYATENTYDIDFQVTIPHTEFLGAGPQATADLYGGYIATLAAEPYTYGVTYGQDVNASGNLVDTLFVIVGDPTGRFLTQVSVPLRSANTPATFAKLQAAATAAAALATGG